MKQTDFDRLKAVCEKEGFELHVTDRDEDQALIIIQKKDIWEGVEFVGLTNFGHGYVYKVIEQKDDQIHIIANGNQWFEKSMFIPSTESAYIEQLKAECFKRFGEIKENQKFITATGREYEFHKSKNVEWNYFKDVDQLFHYNVELYAKGKWATRVKEMVKVEGIHSGGWEKNKPEWEYTFKFKISDLREDAETMHSKVLPFISSKLEEYLNKE